jgi:tetratricopeptide (TPR) repeat protein
MLSEIVFYSGDVQLAEDQCQEALNISEGLQNTNTTSQALFWLGRILLSRSRFDASLDYYDRAARLSEQAGSVHNFGTALIGKGDVFLAQCDYAKARESYGQAVEIFESHGMPSLSTTAYAKMSLGEACLMMGEQEMARVCVQDAFGTFVRVDCGHGMLHCEVLFGDLALTASPPKFADARRHYRTALEHSTKLRHVEEEGMCLARLGSLESREGNNAEAMRRLLPALALFRKASCTGRTCGVLVRLAELLLTQGDFSSAMGLYRAALPVSQSLKALKDEADSLFGIGIIQRSPRLISEARRLYEKLGDNAGVTKTSEELRCIRPPALAGAVLEH